MEDTGQDDSIRIMENVNNDIDEEETDNIGEDDDTDDYDEGVELIDESTLQKLKENDSANWVMVNAANFSIMVLIGKRKVIVLRIILISRDYGFPFMGNLQGGSIWQHKDTTPRINNTSKTSSRAYIRITLLKTLVPLQFIFMVSLLAG